MKNDRLNHQRGGQYANCLSTTRCLLRLRTAQQYAEGVMICVSHHVRGSIVGDALIQNTGKETARPYVESGDKAIVATAFLALT